MQPHKQKEKDTAVQMTGIGWADSEAKKTAHRSPV